MRAPDREGTSGAAVEYTRDAAEALSALRVGARMFPTTVEALGPHAVSVVAPRPDGRISRPARSISTIVGRLGIQLGIRTRINSRCRRA
jgi:hypothetical protein